LIAFRRSQRWGIKALARKRRNSGSQKRSWKGPAGESSPVAPPQQPSPGLSKRRIWIAAATVTVIVAAGGFGFYLLNSSQQASKAQALSAERRASTITLMLDRKFKFNIGMTFRR
jgi:hypothetical protein